MFSKYQQIFVQIFFLWTTVIFALHPDVFLSTVQLVKKYGYPLEIHSVVTQDGYKISIYRIRHGKNGNSTNTKPVLMMHGIASQAESFIINGVNNGSWAYSMADRGYDVWLGNTRGTPHGRKHLFLDTKQKEFWNFSFHEIGLYDLPAIIDYVLEKTNKPKLSYLATSQGCVIFYVMCSYRREYQKKIIIASFLAPAGYMKHFSYPLILPFTRTPKRLQEMLPLAVKFGTSVSLYQILHFVQLINSGHFRPFDHGEEKNIEIYGKPMPDDYPIETIDVPIAMYYSIGDVLIKYQDIEEMCNALPMCVRQFILPNKRWNHLDFVYSVHLTKELIEPVAEFAENYETKFKNSLCNELPEPREMENAECIKSVYN
ncbi:hypothetical protein WA026_018910 [Henosepilachna vigintioctopunctata]|uniref:Lipase n=1 Tax=Henosepilachna vigintioctopunctata TaxID=420089 RepID=A0AAW1ULR1_9CUCU